MRKFMTPAAAAAAALLVLGASQASAGVGGFAHASAGASFAGGEATGSLFEAVLAMLLPDGIGFQARATAAPPASDSPEPAKTSGECPTKDATDSDTADGDDGAKDKRPVSGPEPIYFGF